jgi:hypothetical protein
MHEHGNPPKRKAKRLTERNAVILQWARGGHQLSGTTALRLDLAEGAVSPAVKLLIDRVVTSWLEVQYFEVAGTMVGQDVPPRQAAYMCGRLNTAQRRHLLAIKMPTEVKGLAAGK